MTSDNYRQLLQETKLITHKSLQMIKDKEGSHMEEIEELLSKDSRYVINFLTNSLFSVHLFVC